MTPLKKGMRPSKEQRKYMLGTDKLLLRIQKGMWPTQESGHRELQTYKRDCIKFHIPLPS
jgi:hypothetical protein